ncbi:MAG: TPM domain-containing protein [Myxococcales bacterium]|nr:TPM domain-containing protein [Myxococcales bacterium]
MTRLQRTLPRSPRVSPLVALLCVAWTPLATAEGQVPDGDLPSIHAPVTDLSGVLSAETTRGLTEELTRHRQATGVQLAVLLVDTTAGEPVEDYALRVASRWQGGTAIRSEGALYVLAVRDRRQRLELGYGLEDRIPDYVAAGILEAAIPHLRREDYSAAIEEVMRGVIAASADMTPALEAPRRDGRALLMRLASVPVYGVILLLGTFVGALLRRKREQALTEALSTGVDAHSDGDEFLWLGLWLGLYLTVSGTAAGLLGLGWFHYLGAFVGLFAGWRFAWESIFLTVHYLFMVVCVGIVVAVVVRGFAGIPEFGHPLSFVAQLFVTAIYGGISAPKLTCFASGGVRETAPFSKPSYLDVISGGGGSRKPRKASAPSWKLSRPTKPPARKRDPFASSSSSSRSSSSGSSRASSSSSSGSSSGYKGGGGRFGGGGASSSW